jgi:cyclic beta-1,2-glucan synthetase
LLVVFLAHHAWLMLDAIGRTLYRLIVSRRRLLDWVTADQAQLSPLLDLAGFYRRMSSAVAIGIASAVIVAWAGQDAWLVATPFVIAWIASPAIARWASRSPLVAGRVQVSDVEARALRQVARRSWRYFETFVTAEDNMLPPDNFQEEPKPVVAHRTSPTNVGLYLLCVASARDFGWAGKVETAERLEATFSTMARLQRLRGHFYNWYDTRDLRPLDPQYVSSVDSGNLAGHLIALANACHEWIDDAGADAEVFTGHRGQPDPHAARLAGFARRPAHADDHAASAARGARCARRRVARDAAAGEGHGRPVGGGRASGEDDGRHRSHAGERARRRCRRRNAVLGRGHSDRDRESSPGSCAVRSRRGRAEAAFRRARSSGARHGPGDGVRLSARQGSQAARDRLPRREGTLDPNCYDLLASEARLASFVAIAKGDVASRHWFRLGRAVTPVGRGAALISWSGSMFEYLMPSLVMRAPAGSLLEQTSRLIVRRQIAYGATLGVPWGNLGIRLPRARPRAYLPVFELRRARAWD